MLPMSKQVDKQAELALHCSFSRLGINMAAVLSQPNFSIASLLPPSLDPIHASLPPYFAISLASMSTMRSKVGAFCPETLFRNAIQSCLESRLYQLLRKPPVL